jgi:YebC/PmpR family DNA-binding regulatory protein
MSGHSKWHNIQARKGKQDAKRSNIFSLYAKKIAITAKSGGDPSANFSLRILIDKAKEAGMPKDNIDRAIKRGIGESEDGAQIEECMYEGYGPGGAAVLIKTLSDNKNRTVSDIKHILSLHGGSMGGAGSVAWMFNEWGLISVGSNRFTANNLGREELELILIEAGAEDIVEEEGSIEIKTRVENLQKTVGKLRELGIEPDESGLGWVAKDRVSVSEDNRNKLSGLFSALEENDDVDEYFTNAE